MLGVALTVLFGAWIVLSSVVEGGSPGPMLSLIAVSAGGYLAGRLMNRRPWMSAATATVVTATIVVAVIVNPDALTRDPQAGPLGYANANAALYVQAAALSGVAGASASRIPVRLTFALLTLGLCVLPFVVGSVAGAVTAAVVGLATLAAIVRPSPHLTRVALAVGAAALVASVAVTAAAGARHENAMAGSDPLARALGDRRLALWSDALELAAKSPVTGVGPGGFSTSSATARADPDTREAHSLVLSQAAETGLPGAAAVLALGLWALLRMGRSAAGYAPGAMVAVAGWTGLGLHASVDYVAHYPWVVGLAALVAGLGTSAGESGPVMAGGTLVPPVGNGKSRVQPSHPRDPGRSQQPEQR